MVRKSTRRPRRPRFMRKKRFPRRKQAITNVNRSLQPIPSRYICKMKYATTITTDSTGQYVLNLNSLYDPDRSGTGHQPYGFDTLALLYNRYRVISTGYRILMPSFTAGTPITVGCLPSNDLSLTFPDDSIMRENPRAKYLVQNPGATSLVLKGKVYLPALMGQTKTQYMSDDRFQSIVTTEPVEKGLLYLATFGASNGVAFPTIALNVLLEFTCEWFDVKHIQQS